MKDNEIEQQSPFSGEYPSLPQMGCVELSDGILATIYGGAGEITSLPVLPQLPVLNQVSLSEVKIPVLGTRLPLLGG